MAKTTQFDPADVVGTFPGDGWKLRRVYYPNNEEEVVPIIGFALMKSGFAYPVVAAWDEAVGEVLRPAEEVIDSLVPPESA